MRKTSDDAANTESADSTAGVATQRRPSPGPAPKPGAGGESAAGTGAGGGTALTSRLRSGAARLHLSRKATAWLVGGAALVAATSAAGIVANSPAHPKPAADTAQAGKNALNAILLKHPQLGKSIADLAAQQGLPKPAYAGDTGTIGVPKNAGTLGTAPAGAVMTYVPGSVKGQFNLLQLSSLALWAGCSKSEAPIAAAIAAAESGGNPGAQGDIALMDGTWDWSQGLWQIRGLRSERGTGGLRDSLANASPEKNAKAMYTISSGCTNWTPWSTYMTGAYLPYLGMSRTAVLAAQQYQQRFGTLPPYAGGSTPSVGVPAAAPQQSRRHNSGGSHPAKRPTKHKKPTNSSSTTTKSRHPAAGSTPSAPAPNPTKAAPKPPANPVSSVINKVTSPVKLPLPTSSAPIKLPKPSLSVPKLPLPTTSSIGLP